MDRGKAMKFTILFLQFAVAAFFTACTSGSNSTTVEEICLDELENQDQGENPPSSSETQNPEKQIAPSVVFSEVDPVNLVYKDHEGDDAGWIELFNPTDSVVDLSGMILTDSKSELQKWTFGNVSLNPGETILVFLSGKNLPDYVAPHDTINLVGNGCWAWTDSQNTPIKGESSVQYLNGSHPCFNESGIRKFGGVMRYGENTELGWHSIAFFVGIGDRGNSADARDLSGTNEILLTGYIEKDRKLLLRLAQTGVDDWKGWGKVLTGNGDSTYTYRITLPTGSTLPDLAHIYGTRFSPDDQELRSTAFKINSYIARNRGHEPHANFKLKKTGGTLFLQKPDGILVDSVVYPELPLGKSWSRDNNGWGYAEPSPFSYGQKAVTASREPSPETKVNFPASGFYSSIFTINLSGLPNVRCELGGASPSENSAHLDSIRIVNTTVLRCANFAANSVASDVVTRTYVFETQPQTPVVFLTANPKSLFDPDTGIYMEGPNAQAKDPHFGANYWEDREIPVFVELLEKGAKTPAFAKNAGFQIFGNYSRANKKKSVAIVFREKYGDKRLEYPLFPDFPNLKKFKVFLLRSNGSNFGGDYIRDRLCSSVTEGMDVDYQRGRGVVVYYNGEYFGIHNIRERSTEYYFETHYGMNPDEVDLLKADNSATAGSPADYEALMDWLATNHLDNDKNYAYMAEQIDVDNFINYIHTELFMNNRDWPANNLKKWRGTNPKTRWKWFIYDMDFGFGNEFSEFKNNIFEFATAEDGPDWPNGPASTLLLRRLLENKDFKTAFINRFPALLSMNFEKSRLLARINTMMAEIESQISKDQRRWSLSASYMNGQLDKIKTFAETRQDVILSEMKEFFALGEPAKVTLSVSGSGKILVHNLPLDRSSMTVSFFKGTPVTITAQENGGTFTGWSDKVTAKTRTIMPEEVSSLTANFK
ncbi:MAG: CotH kinase family protein [Fibrobacter sp.]|nr:CotH kinase family protein [Fibrobacter sp.]